MELIVAVYDDWGIGKDGTQPVTVSADRTFFRETTKGACVIVGRKTLADFPNGKPLKNRANIVLSRSERRIDGAEMAHSPAEAADKARSYPRSFVIGGGSVYRAMLRYCNRAYVTKLHIRPESDTFFENLDASGEWRLADVLRTGEEAGIQYEMCLYERVKRTNMQSK